jgi:uncharacterized protein YbjT (DUF2867 family)
MSKTAWVAGASGLIGQHLIEQLVADENYKRIIAFVRTPLPLSSFQHAKVEQFKVNFDALQAPDSQVDSLFCALGSTTRKTPNHDDYYRIDVTYPFEFAKLGLEKGAQFYGLVSAHGANADSFSSYLKMKGTLEQQLTKLGYPRLAIARPSLLKGDRQEFRFLEKAGEGFMSLLPGNYRAIDAKRVAQALIQADKNMRQGKRILQSKDMQSPAEINF